MGVGFLHPLRFPPSRPHLIIFFSRPSCPAASFSSWTRTGGLQRGGCWSGRRKLTPTCDCTPTNCRTSVLMRQTPWSYVAPFTYHPHADHQIHPEIHHRERSVHGVLLFGRSGATYDHKSGLIRTGVLQLVRGAIGHACALPPHKPWRRLDRGLSTCFFWIFQVA
jgi:hypothetical protein